MSKSPQAAHFPDPDWGKIDTLLDVGKVDEALAAASDDVARISAENGDASENYCHSLRRLAYVHTERAEHEQAIAALRQVSPFVAETYGEDSEEYSNVTRWLAYHLLMSGAIGEGAIFATKAVAILERFGGDDNPAFADALTGTALVHQKRGDLVAAESLYARSLRLRSCHFGKVHRKFAWGLFNLAVIYQVRQRTRPAQLAFERIVRMHESGECTDELLYAKALRQLGILKENVGDMESAGELITKAINVFTSLRGIDHPDTQRARDDLHRVSDTRHNARRGTAQMGQ
jgi:tetratricopeptide (TPR) repeat protein